MNERHCDGMYPMYGQMPYNPMMPYPNNNCNNDLENRISNLEKRVLNLEKMLNTNNYNNYQMM